MLINPRPPEPVPDMQLDLLILLGPRLRDPLIRADFHKKLRHVRALGLRRLRRRRGLLEKVLQHHVGVVLVLFGWSVDICLKRNLLGLLTPFYLLLFIHIFEPLEIPDLRDRQDALRALISQIPNLSFLLLGKSLKTLEKRPVFHLFCSI